MLTFFTIPKAFKGNIATIQKNAIKSWKAVHPSCQILLFGDDPGVREAARELKTVHIPEIKKNEFGTPLLNSAFKLAQLNAKYDILVYINTDIITLADFREEVKKIDKPLFLIAGRRWNIKIQEELKFEEEWKAKLKERIKKEGQLHGFTGIDYFIFPKTLPHDLLPFAVGRPGWDNWLIYHIRSLKIPVIDATDVITIIHQDHPSIYRPWDEESQKNFKLAGGFSQMLTLRDVDWVLTSEGLKKPPFSRRIFANLSSFWIWRKILSIKRGFQYTLKHGK